MLTKGKGLSQWGELEGGTVVAILSCATRGQVSEFRDSVRSRSVVAARRPSSASVVIVFAFFAAKAAWGVSGSLIYGAHIAVDGEARSWLQG